MAVGFTAPGIGIKELPYIIGTGADSHVFFINTDMLIFNIFQAFKILHKILKEFQSGVFLKSDFNDIAEYEFRIKDNGIGMSEEFQKTIFDEFTRERTSTVSGIQGTGLGMAITKNIVEKMGGSISVKSAEGEGSEFIIDIPFRISAAPADSAEKTVTSLDEYDFTGKRVLLAEDNEMNQTIATALLGKAGFAVETAANGQETVDKVRDASDGYFDIILMDIQMPVMDGYEATRQIRALEDPAKAAIPIIAVTANAFEEDRKSAMELGMDGHLAKPYDVPKMMDMIQRLLRQSS